MASVLRGQSFHESRLFQLGEASVQRPRTELHACKAFDVFDEAIAVLWTTGQAGENEDAAIRGPANPFDRHVDLPFDVALQSRYIGEWSSATTGQTEASPPAVQPACISVMATVATAPSLRCERIRHQPPSPRSRHQMTPRAQTTTRTMRIAMATNSLAS